MKALRLSRRELLVAGAAGSVALASGLPAACSSRPAAGRVNAYVSFGSDGRIVLINPAIEMGQGSDTAMAQVQADAMDADWAGISVQPAPSDSVYGDPHFDKRLVTADSASTQSFWPMLRKAGSQARVVLVWNAARRWGVAAVGLDTRASEVLHPDGRRLRYADLAADATLPSRLSQLPRLAACPSRLDGQKHLYRVPRQHIESVHPPSPLACGFLRGVGAGFSVLAIESLVDEAALAGNHHSLAYRLQMLDDPRARRVLQALGDWAAPLELGLAAGHATMHLRGSHIALRAIVARVDGGPAARQLQAVVDCGRVVNAALARCQVEGAALMGLSLALRESLDFDNGHALQDSLAAYPLLRAHELPPVACRFIDPDQGDPRGLGEIALPVVAPAVANAWRRSTGSRLLATPLLPSGS